MRTLADRIKWIQGNSGSKELSIAEVARRGGMTRQGLSSLMRKSRKDPSKQQLGLSDTMEKLANGNHVDVVWLMTGRGAPKKGKLSARDVVLAEHAWSEPARAAALADKRKLTAEQWRELLRGFEALLGGGDQQPKSKKPSQIPK